MTTEFGEWIREKRLSKDISLRKFSNMINISPYKWSKIERGYSKFPMVGYNMLDVELVHAIKQVLELSNEEFDRMDLLIRLHNIENDIIVPPDFRKILPAFWCFSAYKTLSDEDINKLIETIKELYSKE